MKKYIKQWMLGCTMLVFLLSGCSNSDEKKNVDQGKTQTETEQSTKEQVTEEPTTEKITAKVRQVKTGSQIPKYSGKAYVSIHGNQPDFTKKEKKSTSAFERYSNLDELGRCGVAYANICKKLMPTQKRGAIGMVKPSGWKTVKYDFVDGKYLFNRCHLIGFQLAGENANEKNLITGTRSLNIEGMLPFENMVADYVKETNHHVLYRVTPVFSGNNLVADGVKMEGWSVEDGGKSICFNVYAYNVEPGVSIQYANGESKATNGATASSSKSVTRKKNTTTNSSNSKGTQTYVININTGKFHLRSCYSLKRMKEKNKRYEKGTRNKLIQEGYDPCQNCNP